MSQGTMASATAAPKGAPADGLDRALSERVAAEVEARVSAHLAALEERLRACVARTVSHKATLVVFSGDMDKVLASLVIATGAAALGLEVTVFHTFWGLSAVRKGRKLAGKGLVEKALAVAMPAGMEDLSPSKLAFAGAGARLFRARMKEKGVQSPEELYALAKELGVRFLACEMSMEVMGIGRDELLDDVEVAGVAAYLGHAADSRVTLFI